MKNCVIYNKFSDPKIKDQIRKYLAQSSNAFHHSELPILDSNDFSETQQLLTTSSSSTSSLKAPTSSSRGAVTAITNASTSAGRSQGLGHRTTSSDPTSRPSRIPQAIKSPTHSPASTIGAGTIATKSHSHPQSPQSAKSVALPLSSHIPTSNGSFNNNGTIKEQTKARFEAYMMTGDLILNLSRTPQSSGLLPMQNKKVSLKIRSTSTIPITSVDLLNCYLYNLQ